MNLTNDMRETIIRRAITHRFERDRSKLREREDTLFTALHETQFSAEDIRTMKSLPQGWLQHRSRISVDPGVDVPGYYRFDARTAVPVPADAEWHVPMADLPKRLQHRIQRFVDAKKRLDVKERELRQDIRGVLYSFRTVATLLKAWPEAKQFMADMDTEKKQLPAIRVDELNKKLHLAA